MILEMTFSPFAITLTRENQDQAAEVEWLVSCLVGQLGGWLVSQLGDRLVAWEVGFVVGWLVDQLVGGWFTAGRIIWSFCTKNKLKREAVLHIHILLFSVECK